MPPAMRRHAPLPAPTHFPQPLSDSDDPVDNEGFEDDDDELGGELLEVDVEEEEEEEDEEQLGSSTQSSDYTAPIPPNYREISTLASWTVSSSKPGCSIPQLRSPSTSLFWQSDGPQPHYLNIHFFKLVRIVGLRLFLDFDSDESYTPTRIVFLAGSGMNDLVEWGEMRLEQPKGWIWADFEGVGEGDSDDDEISSDDEDEDPDFLPNMNGGANQHNDDSEDHENMLPTPSQQQQQPRRRAQNIPSDPMALDTPNPNATTPQTAHPFQTPTPTHAQNLTPTLAPQTRFTLPPPPLPVPQAAATPTTAPPSLPRPTTRTALSPLPPTSSSPAAHEEKKGKGRKKRTPVLRAHLLQIKILENHQNGKDTHLRGLQVFARDNEATHPRKKDRRSLGLDNGGTEGLSTGLGRDRDRGELALRGLSRPAWDVDAVIR